MIFKTFVVMIGILVASVCKVESIDWKSNGEIIWSDNCFIPLGDQIGGEPNTKTDFDVASTFCRDWVRCTSFTIDSNGYFVAMSDLHGSPVDSSNSLCGYIKGRYTIDPLTTQPPHPPPTQSPKVRATGNPQQQRRARSKLFNLSFHSFLFI